MKTLCTAAFFGFVSSDVTAISPMLVFSGEQLQSLLVLSRESRVISRRVDTLVDTDAPTAADLPEFFN